ncbi:MAG: helix-turn-helix domain-containing protein [Deltaproteobacteria bacterium]|jgi:predicted transcriptional regulator|nr:helix-turn-helix domain-containing protein [Deltaproteobacteria bacterium]
MDDFTNYLNKQLKNKEFKKEWDKLELRYQFIQKLIALREENKISQSELAKRVGTTQSVISRIENGSVNIGIDMIQRIASAFGRTATVCL